MGDPAKVTTWFKMLCSFIALYAAGMGSVLYYNFTQDEIDRAVVHQRVTKLVECKLEQNVYEREHAKLEVIVDNTRRELRSSIDRLESKMDMAMERANERQIEMMKLLERLKTIIQMKSGQSDKKTNLE